ncbi:MAG: hypothetical protein IPH76_17510 [Xanthomonadales bacterium]|nr:hypothetical protein [Xanthomonadales bacterium]
MRRQRAIGRDPIDPQARALRAYKHAGAALRARQCPAVVGKGSEIVPPARVHAGVYGEQLESLRSGRNRKHRATVRGSHRGCTPRLRVKAECSHVALSVLGEADNFVAVAIDVEVTAECVARDIPAQHVRPQFCLVIDAVAAGRRRPDDGIDDRRCNQVRGDEDLEVVCRHRIREMDAESFATLLRVDRLRSSARQLTSDLRIQLQEGRDCGVACAQEHSTDNVNANWRTPRIGFSMDPSPDLVSM